MLEYILFNKDTPCEPRTINQKLAVQFYRDEKIKKYMDPGNASKLMKNQWYINKINEIHDFAAGLALERVRVQSPRSICTLYG